MFRLQLPRNTVRIVTVASVTLILRLPTTVMLPALARDEQLWDSGTNRVGERGPPRLSITNFTPHIVVLHSTLITKMQVYNISSANVSNIVLCPQRTGALASSADAWTILAESESAFNAARTFSTLIELKAGRKREVTLSIPVSAPASEGLGITEVGTFPSLIDANGQPADGVGRLLTGTHALLPVTDPQAEGDEPEPLVGDKIDSDETDNSDASTCCDPVPFSLI